MTVERRGASPVRALTTALYVAAAIGLAVAFAVQVWTSLTRNALWEDEAFNLTVPLNLLRGLGYTSDGTLSGSELVPFDPRISTGPVVLIPIAGVLAVGGDLVVGSRLVPLAFFVALLIGAGILGRRLAGRWGALIAVAVPLAFTARALPSPIQGPADILGEVPAAALLIWAMVAVRRRPWLAGLLIGFAVLAKIIALLAVPAFVVGVWVSLRGIPAAARMRRLLLPALLVVAPYAVFELVALLSFGFAGWLHHVRLTLRFLRSGGQTQSSSVGEKLEAFTGAWNLPGSIVAVLLLVALVVGVAALVITSKARRATRAALTEAPGGDVPILLIAAIGFSTFLLWWMSAGHLPAWVRHPAPGILAFGPVLAAGVAQSLQDLWRAPSNARMPMPRTLGALAAVPLAAALAVSVGAGAVATGVGAAAPVSALDEQRRVAAMIADFGHEHIATLWGGPVSLVVLAGAHVALTDAPAATIAGVPRLIGANDVTGCTEIEADFGNGLVLCVPAPR